jgi:hypothetical protein
MDLFEMIQGAGGGNAIGQIGSQFGLSEEQTHSALGALLPALGGALQRNAQQSGGIEELLGALGGSQHSQYLDNPGGLGSPESIEAGNGILGQLLGSKDVSRAVAQNASSQTGLDPALLKKMLPMLAMLVGGFIARQHGAAQAAPAAQADSLGLENLLGSLLGGGSMGGTAAASPMAGLGSLLDLNGDGNPLDDILRMAGSALR